MWLGCEWRHARKRWAGILGDFEKKSSELRSEAGRGSWDLNLEEVSWFSNLDEASPVVCYGMRCALLGQMEQSA